ncbi:MAG: ADP-ribosylglycohydrolase family protein [Aquiluna sp.]|nr:ADP-ribosylglycohydrolase family protein [Aquiluna sp.]
MKKSDSKDSTAKPPHSLESRIVGALASAAVGDAIGGATEGWMHEQIMENWGGFVLGLAPTHKQNTISPWLERGNGRVTDDTLMTNLMIDTITELNRHIDAFDLGDVFVPKMAFEKRWLPEMQIESNVLNRVFLAEKYLVLKLLVVKSDPREAGVGNAVNCGAAMYASPIGLINAGRPERAYDEAISVFGAHQASYGREAAGVMAACVAEAASPDGSSVERITKVALDLSKDGTHEAIAAVLEAAKEFSDWQTAVTSGRVRDAIAPFDTVGEKYREPDMGAKMPSRTKSIEELPVALAMLQITDGDVRGTILGGTNYGRDADSIASMGGAIAGALGGAESVPSDWAAKVEEASGFSIFEPAQRLAKSAEVIARRDLATLAKEIDAVNRSLIKHG